MSRVLRWLLIAFVVNLVLVFIGGIAVALTLFVVLAGGDSQSSSVPARTPASIGSTIQPTTPTVSPACPSGDWQHCQDLLDCLNGDQQACQRANPCNGLPAGAFGLCPTATPTATVDLSGLFPTLTPFAALTPAPVPYDCAHGNLQACPTPRPPEFTPWAGRAVYPTPYQFTPYPPGYFGTPNPYLPR